MKNKVIIPEVNDIKINKWYICLIGQSEELCKVTRHSYIDRYTGQCKFSWKVVCYYTGKDLFAGELGDCKRWLRDRLYLIWRG